VNNRDLFYATPAIKFASVAYRGAWAALGIEFNFGVAQLMTVSPVDYATTRHADAAPRCGSQHRSRLRRPVARRADGCGRIARCWSSTPLLYNRSASRHRFYWWTNAAAASGRQPASSIPTHSPRRTASPRWTLWPVDARGVDLSVVRTHTTGPGVALQPWQP